MKLTKRNKQHQQVLAEKDIFSLEDGIETLKNSKKSNFDESVEVVIKLGIDPRKTDQAVRGSCSLPNGTGKQIRVLVFAKGDKLNEANEAGADYAGGAELAEKIKTGWLDFERVVATPDMMIEVGKIGKILGPRNLMPNPKTGTVTFEVGKIVSEIKKGQIQFKNDKGGNIHVLVGKLSFNTSNIKENIMSVIDSVNKLKPTTAKGIYLQDMNLSSTMGPGLKINLSGLT